MQENLHYSTIRRGSLVVLLKLELLNTSWTLIKTRLLITIESNCQLILVHMTSLKAVKEIGAGVHEPFKKLWNLCWKAHLVSIVLHVLNRCQVNLLMKVQAPPQVKRPTLITNFRVTLKHASPFRIVRNNKLIWNILSQ